MATRGSLTFRKFLDVHMDEDGRRQTLGAQQQEPFPELMCVLVVLKKTGQDRFFILEWKELQNLVVRSYTEYLSNHNFVRPRKPDSFHMALLISDLAPFENDWRKILDRVPATLQGSTAPAEGKHTAAVPEDRKVRPDTRKLLP